MTHLVFLGKVGKSPDNCTLQEVLLFKNGLSCKKKLYTKVLHGDFVGKKAIKRLFENFGSTMSLWVEKLRRLSLRLRYSTWQGRFSITHLSSSSVRDLRSTILEERNLKWNTLKLEVLVGTVDERNPATTIREAKKPVCKSWDKLAMNDFYHPTVSSKNCFNT